jgi:hypothetical protein
LHVLDGRERVKAVADDDDTADGFGTHFCQARPRAGRARARRAHRAHIDRHVVTRYKRPCLLDVADVSEKAFGADGYSTRLSSICRAPTSMLDMRTARKTSVQRHAVVAHRVGVGIDLDSCTKPPRRRPR